ncbi:ShlB/FhaC/HecB family hemolysin secretion/activation protein, partial [Hydrogenophaga sp.]|uniref:ShlB/FhaC/HecB family hemolysin secretion/activation protein n=1 Tax=Hydrogenophaga sp. TaxID=1904254 RepID=UPI003569A7D1
MKKTTHVLLGALLGASAHLPATAQTDPGAVQRLDQDNRERFEQQQQLEKRAPQAPAIGVPGQADQPGGQSDVKNIPVTRFEVDRSELLTPAQIAAVLEPLQGRTVSLNDLFAAVGRLNALYEAQGVQTARAILPAQDIAAGVVKIRLIEAHLGAIQLSGAQYLKPGFVTERIHQQPGDLVSVTRLEADLVRFNALYESQLRADVVAGAEVGTTDIALVVQETPRYQLTTFADNAGRDTVGEGRVGLVFRANHLLGVHDSMQVVVNGSQGAKSYGLSYSVPVSRDDLRLDIAYTQGRIKIVDGPFEPLDITGRSKDFSLGLSQPFAVDLNGQWAAYGRFSARNSLSRFGGITQSDVDLNVLALGVRGQARDERRAWSLDGSLNIGTKALGGEQHFAYFRGQASRVDHVGERTQLLTRAGLQHSFSRILPAGEQFQVGGLYSVRGFSEGLLTGRDGYSVGLELRQLLKAPSAQEQAALVPTVQGLVFLDHGAAFPYRPGQSISNDDYLTSAGLGLAL